MKVSIALIALTLTACVQVQPMTPVAPVASAPVPMVPKSKLDSQILGESVMIAATFAALIFVGVFAAERN